MRLQRAHHSTTQTVRPLPSGAELKYSLVPCVLQHLYGLWTHVSTELLCTFVRIVWRVGGGTCMTMLHRAMTKSAQSRV